MNDIQILIDELLRFREERNWSQFHNTLVGKHDLDVKEIVMKKINKNGEKYPVEKSKRTAKKYNEL
jgi:tRNA(Ser,Leu) C12 N-acetylase TAN1